MGWAFLPPIQRTLDTPIAPLTRPTSFPAELPVWRSPAFTSTLSHAVVDTLPGGVVDGDGGGSGEPSHTVGPAPELTLLPPPRPTALQRSVVDPAAPEEQPAPPAVEPVANDEHPERRAPDVVRPEVPAPTLTRAPSVGMPLVHRSVVPDAPPLEPDPPTPPAPDVDAAPDDLPDRPALGSPAAGTEPLSPSPSPGEAGSPAAVQRSASPPLAAPVSPVTLPVPRAKLSDVSAPVANPRLGLGAPLVSAPETAIPTPPESYDEGAAPVTPDQEFPASPAVPVPPISPTAAADNGFTEVPIQRALAPGARPSPAPTPAGPTVQPPADLPAPELTLARSVDPAPEAPPPSSSESVIAPPEAKDPPAEE